MNHCFQNGDLGLERWSILFRQEGGFCRGRSTQVHDTQTSPRNYVFWKHALTFNENFISWHCSTTNLFLFLSYLPDQKEILLFKISLISSWYFSRTVARLNKASCGLSENSLCFGNFLNISKECYLHSVPSLFRRSAVAASVHGLVYLYI